MDVERQLQLAENVAYLLDGRYRIFGLRVGLLSFLDLIPEIGDIISFLLSLYLIRIAFNLKVPPIGIAVMILNILINLLVGLVPVAGDAIYIFHKANLRNLKILKDHANRIEG